MIGHLPLRKGTRGILYLLPLLCSAHATAAPQLSFAPATLDLAVGQSALVEIRISAVPASGLAAYQYQLAFNQNLVSITDPSSNASPFQPANWFLISTGRNVGAEWVDTPTPGAIQMAFATHGSQQPASGSGVLGVIQVDASAQGSFTTQLSNVLLVDNQNPPQQYSVELSGLTVNVSAVADTDGDGLSDTIEQQLGTSINQADTDGDGLSDFNEVNRDGNPSNYSAGTDLNPLDNDTDDDGMLDGIDPQPLVPAPKPKEDIPFLPLWAYVISFISLMLIRRKTGAPVRGEKL